jgi:hypothetical protein
VTLAQDGKQPVTMAPEPSLWAAYYPIWGQSAVKAMLGMRADLDERVDEYATWCSR